MSSTEAFVPVSRLVRRGPVTVEPTATLRQVCATLFREEVGVAIVIKDGEPIGLVSERDVVRALADDDADVDDSRAEDVMAFEVVSVPAQEDVTAAAARMIDGQIRHLLVTDGTRAVGVVSMRDVLESAMG